jgi:hypothetical protein
MRSGSNRGPRWVLVVALTVVVLAFASVEKNAAAQSGGSGPGPAGNGWRPLLQLSTGTSASYTALAGIKQSSGDWAAFTTSYYACGHCGFVETDIHLKHVLDGRQINITGSRGEVPSSGDPTSVQEVRFAAPYLLWYQPGPANAFPGRFTPGQFACTLCYYDVSTGKGGPLTDLVPSLQVPADKEGYARPVALDPSGTGRALITVTKVSQDGSGQPESGRLFLANIKTGDLKEIPLTAPALYFAGTGATLNGDVIAWVQFVQGGAQSMYLYDDKTGQVSQPPPLAGVKAYSLHSNGKSLFFSVPNTNDLSRYDFATGQLTTIPNVGAYNYDVYGDLMAVTPPEKGRIVISDLRDNHVVADLMVISPEAARDSLNAPVGMSLSADKLVFSAVGLGGTGLVNAHHLGISWLTAPDAAFDKVWAKADAPVAAGKATRSWLWGPAPAYTGWEPYAGLPGGKRQVRYYDKSRMEVNNPEANPNDPFYVTNGLLVAEMIGGEVRLGETEISATTACTLTVAGDPRKDNPLTPSYATLRGVASIKGDHTSTNRTGQFASDAIDVNGAVSHEGANARAAKYVSYVPQTGHNIPDLFWTYLQAMKAQYGYDWTYTMGYPITEAYWTQMRVGGKDYPVLIQAYQRRVMTYTPAFPTAWRVQQGNVGQHYFEWRYVLTNK